MHERRQAQVTIDRAADILARAARYEAKLLRDRGNHQAARELEDQAEGIMSLAMRISDLRR